MYLYPCCLAAFLRRLPSHTTTKELRRKFQAAGSNATAFAVNPGAVRSDIWRFVPKLVKPVFDVFIRLLFLNVEEGCCTSVCTSTLPVEKLSGESSVLLEQYPAVTTSSGMCRIQVYDRAMATSKVQYTSHLSPCYLPQGATTTSRTSYPSVGLCHSRSWVRSLAALRARQVCPRMSQLRVRRCGLRASG